MTEEKNICPFCGKDLDESGEGYCPECYSEVSEEIGELASIKYTLDNCIKSESDRDILDDIKAHAEDLIHYVKDLEQKVKQK